jgi:integrase
VATLQAYVRTLKAFFSWLEREEYMAVNPLTKLSVPRAPAKIISTFTAEDIERLLPVCQQGNGPCICRDGEVYCPCDQALAMCREDGFCTCRLFVSRERYPEVLRKAMERWHQKRR